MYIFISKNRICIKTESKVKIFDKLKGLKNVKVLRSKIPRSHKILEKDRKANPGTALYPKPFNPPNDTIPVKPMLTKVGKFGCVGEETV